jgi:hypothetical protein
VECYVDFSVQAKDMCFPVIGNRYGNCKGLTSR